MKTITIRDIAREAGVSVTTVSRVLNNRPDVSAETQKRVREVIDACHFVGNVNARGLKQTDQDLIAVIIRGRMNPFLNALTEAILQAALPERATVVTEFIDEQANEFQRAAQLMNERRVAGIIFVGSRIDGRAAICQGVSVPMVFVTVSSENTLLSSASSVCVDDQALAYEAVSALFDRGCRRVAVFGGARDGRDSLALRAQGALRAGEDHERPIRPEDYMTTRLTLEDAYATAKSYFSRKSHADGAFCMSDMAALGVMRALHDLGLNVPGDVSLIGVDGIEIGAYTTPRLSTVIQPVDELAQKAVTVLDNMMRRAAPPEHITIGARLVLRESVRNN